MPNKPVPVATLDPSCVWNPDPDVAALAGLERAPYSGREYALALYRNDNGDYCYSLPVEGSTSDFQFRLDKSGGLTLGGLAHSHPGGQDAGRFSVRDVEMANKLNLPSYIRNNDDGEVKRYTPGVTRTLSAGAGARAAHERISPGTPVGKLSRKEQIEAAYDLHSENKAR